VKKNKYTIIVTIQYGSHLYGTNTPESDLDIKGIYLPYARDILLQRVKPAITELRHKKRGEKNIPEDIDYELYNPEKYLISLAKGQSFALEMLFAPDWAILDTPDKIWEKIRELAPKILTKQAASFVNYCKQQAYKYCFKGARLAAARLVLGLLETKEKNLGTTTKLSAILEELEKLAQNNEYLSLIKDDKDNTYFQICGKKALLTASIKSARILAEKIVSRALEAEKSKGSDWKALSHAVRIGHQAIEFLTTHKMTFPRPEAAHLLAIKQGKISFEQVTQEIEQLLTDVQKAAQESTLPEHYDQEIIDNFIEKIYLKQVIESKK